MQINLTPDDIVSLGVGLYRPESEDLALVLYNPQRAPVENLQAMDKAGKLAEAFPSITDFLDDSAEAEQASGQEDAVVQPQRVPVQPAPSGVWPPRLG